MRHPPSQLFARLLVVLQVQPVKGLAFDGYRCVPNVQCSMKATVETARISQGARRLSLEVDARSVTRLACSCSAVGHTLSHQRVSLFAPRSASSRKAILSSGRNGCTSTPPTFRAFRR